MMMDEANTTDHVSKLSQEQLAQLLQHIPMRQCLSGCSLVHSSWRAAAAMATIAVTTTNSSTLSPWLRAHTAAVAVRSISVSPSSSDALLELPMAQLASLQELVLDKVPWTPLAAPLASSSSSSSSSSNTKHPGLSLTSLKLTGRSVRLEDLPAFTALQELELRGTQVYHNPHEHDLDEIFPGHVTDTAASPSLLDRMFPDESVPDFDRATAALTAALPQLQRLTSLKLVGDLGDQEVVSHLSSLQRLQQLVLIDGADLPFGRRPALLSFSDVLLPAGLTSLRLQFVNIRSSSISPAGSPCIAQLARLQSLHLKGVVLFDSAVLAGMRQLTSLSMWAVTFVSAPGQLQVFSRLTALQSLSILLAHGRQPGAAAAVPAVTPADAAALTASSQLTALDVLGLLPVLMPLHYTASMFPAGKQLPRLSELRLGSDLLSSAAAAAQVAACCSNLTHLRLDKPAGSSELDEQASAALAEGLGHTTCFGKLLALGLTTHKDALTRGVWQALAGLTGLSSLCVSSLQPDLGDALCLTACRGLQKLVVENNTEEGFTDVDCNLCITSKAPPGEAPDVWQQLPRELLVAANIQLMCAVKAGDWGAVSQVTTSQMQLTRAIVRKYDEQEEELKAAQEQVQQLQQRLRQAQEQLQEAQQQLVVQNEDAC